MFTRWPLEHGPDALRQRSDARLAATSDSIRHQDENPAAAGFFVPKIYGADVMDYAEVQEVIACLPEERTVFNYFQDRYAFLLLARAATELPTMSVLRGSSFGRLLDKPVVKAHLGAQGSARLEPEWLLAYWPADGVQDFVLTLGQWGCPRDRWYSQTSRRGFNLVLQLNLNAGAMRQFARLVDYPGDYNAYAHPVCSKRGHHYRETLAWARLDVDFNANEVLVEEVQSDFVRAIERYRQRHKDHAAVQAFARPYQRVWQEAMLAATLQFIWQELGVRRVFYHEHHTGCALKGIRKRLPPRSIYERLPQKFCMQLGSQIPRCLIDDRSTRSRLRRLKEPRFYQLEASGR